MSHLLETIARIARPQTRVYLLWPDGRMADYDVVEYCKLTAAELAGARSFLSEGERDRAVRR